LAYVAVSRGQYDARVYADDKVPRMGSTSAFSVQDDPGS
jgi:ATP-dependent exoDNAse (exonuclease V) alpha subunit